MTCTKTGATIYIAPYDLYAHCDAFEMEKGVAYFRIVNTWRPGERAKIPRVQYVVLNADVWFDKDKAQISTLITNQYVFYGYEGEIHAK